MIFLMIMGSTAVLLLIIGLIFWALKKSSVYMDGSFRWGGRSDN